MDEDRRVLARSKSNIGPDEGGFEYGIAQTKLEAWPDVQASVIDWRSAVVGTARELLADAEADSNSEGDDAADVDGFLRGLLAVGPMSAKVIKTDADGAGYAWRTVHLRHAT